MKRGKTLCNLKEEGQKRNKRTTKEVVDTSSAKLKKK